MAMRMPDLVTLTTAEAPEEGSRAMKDCPAMPGGGAETISSAKEVSGKRVRWMWSPTWRAGRTSESPSMGREECRKMGAEASAGVAEERSRV